MTLPLAPVGARAIDPLAALPLRTELRGQHAYGAPQLDVPIALNTNENPYPVPDAVVAAMQADLAAELPQLNRYPDRECVRLRTALARYVSSAATPITPEQIWPANGSNEVLQQIFQAFGGPGHTALGFTPDYAMYPLVARGTGTTWVAGHRPGADAAVAYQLTAEAVLTQVREHDPDLVVFCSPNNPTGTALDLEVVAQVAERSRALIVVDEAYVEFARDPASATALGLLSPYPQVVVCRTLSKALALAGARLGYAIAHPQLCQALRLVRLPYHLSTLTQVVASIALAHAPVLLEMVGVLRAQRDRIVAALPELGLQPVPSDANFVLFGGLDDAALTWRALVDAGVLIRDVGITGHLRVTAGTPDQTEAFLQALADVVGAPLPPLATTKGIR